MQDEIARIFAAMRELPDFSDINPSDINASGLDGDTALHYVVRQGDHSAVQALIEAGIYINRAGDLGYTPLHVACCRGDIQMVTRSNAMRLRTPSCVRCALADSD
jgi:ankyrin repeat protein